MNLFRTRVARAAFILTVLSALSAAHAETSAAEDDERILRDAGLSTDGPALLAFFHARARLDVDGEQLRQLLSRFAGDDERQRAEAQAKLLGLGALALPALRLAANDLSQPQAAARAADCLVWLEGPSSHKLLTAAIHVLAQRKPEGAAAALLAFLPYADNAEVIAAVTSALAAVAAPAGKVDPALVRGLSDNQSIRRAAAGVALCAAVPPEQVPDVRKLLKDPAAKVRLRAAKALAQAKDAEAIPVLIDLLAELSADERQPVENLLKELAGEWAPVLQFATDDAISRGVRRDAWTSWWRRTDGPALLAALAQHTLTPDKNRQLQKLLPQLGSDDFSVREGASRKLLAFGRLALPSLREVVKARDAEAARRAKMLIERIEKGPDVRLPLAALRLLAVRKPVGGVEALLAYLPYAEDELREEELRKSLGVLVRRDGKLAPALRHALADAQPKVRVLAAKALIEGGGSEGRAAVRKLLKEDKPTVRLQLALALARAGERDGVAVLIDLLPLLSTEECGQAEEVLHQLAGDTAPSVKGDAPGEDKKKRRDAWVAWWKLNAARVDLSRLNQTQQLGHTLVCTILPQGANDYLYEVDRHGKKRWTIANLANPTDAVVLSDNRVLIATAMNSLVSERDFQGRILWQTTVNVPLRVQRLGNGNTFILCQKQLVEVDRTGKVLYAINKFADQMVAGYRLRTGGILCLTKDGQCRFLDTTGKELRGFATKHSLIDKQGGGSLDLLASGHILITSRGANKVTEYDLQGNLRYEWDVPKVHRATGLPGGHVLVSTGEGNRVLELDRAGKIVWEHKGDGPIHCIRRR